MTVSELEETLAFQLRVTPGIPPPVREYRFAPPRRWRADFAWPDRRLLVEVEGGQWTAGRHTRGAGYAGDVEKYNTAALLGWRVLRFTAGMVETGEALTQIEEALTQKKGV